MKEQLSLSLRPTTLDMLVGQDQMVASIRGQIKSERMIKSWLFVGQTGCGKTTTARILALSFQCQHQIKFGSPCKECRKAKSSFDIYEINASKVTGIRELEQELNGSELRPRMGPYRVYILDECHRASAAAQSLILKYLEDSPSTTIYILCTTDPHMLTETIQSRCGAGTYRLKELSIDDTTVLVSRILAKVSSDLPVDSLVDALIEAQICYPRSIVQATEKYLAGVPPIEAVDVQGAIEIDTKALTRAVVKGDWPGVAKYLIDAQPNDARPIRLSTLAYLRKILLQSPEISDRTKAVADAVSILCSLQNTEGTVMAAGIASALYGVTSKFADYKH